ncbi:MAG: SDR family NAD(P)-dependent oxidoreductase [Bdellovibrionales bacterium]|nr:SDR family NAD(P)-dependent oxidoreductase [Bdellovibrionales bacterium]
MATAFITGATSGIGKACAKALAQQGWNIIATGRREDNLNNLKSWIEENTSVKLIPLCFDISDRQQCESIFADHQESFKNLKLLINNAGLAKGVDTMDAAHLDDWEAMIDTNVKGLLYVTRLALDFLKQNAPAQIINIGSVAGRWTYPGGGVYCATKFAVRALTEGLRMDLLGKNIRVTNISPGMVETEFSEVRFSDKEKAKKVYEGMTPLLAQDIAECVRWAASLPDHVNIQELVVYPTDQASVRDVHRQ